MPRFWRALSLPADRGCGPSPRAASCRRLHDGKRRLVLRRAAAALRPAALPARGGAGRIGGARPGHLRQLRRPARAAGAVGRAQADRQRPASPPHRSVRHGGVPAAGRWSAEPAGHADRKLDAGAIEHVARALLRRYGVVFWRLLEREAAWLPPWRELLRVYRRLESSGEIRGGRFVAGFSGEQFALPEAIGLLREIRRRPSMDEWTAVSGADPLNLAGILTPGPRLAALAGNRVALSRRRPGRDLVRRRDPLRRSPRSRDRVVRPQGAGARNAASAVHRQRGGQSSRYGAI